MAINKAAYNLRFIKQGFSNLRGLVEYLQAVFGMCTTVTRLSGQATVASGTTTKFVADPGILAGDTVWFQEVTQGVTAGTWIVSYTTTLSGTTGFTVTTNQDPSTGGLVFNYEVHRQVP